MFSSSFAETQEGPHLKIVTVDCSPTVLEAVLIYLYTERTEFGLELAIDVLFAADILFIERLKTKAAQVIAALGSGALLAKPSVSKPAGAEGAAEAAAGAGEEEKEDAEPLDPFAVINAAYDLRVPRLEEFAARFLAYRLESYVDQPEFAEAVAKSAARIRNRQETDSIELVDDIRYFLSERFRLRFEGEGIEEMLNEDAAAEAEARVGPEVGEKAEGRSDGQAEGQAEGANDGAVNAGADADNTAVAIHGALAAGEFRTLDGEIAGDEFASDAINYQLLLDKIEAVLERLSLET